MFFLTLILVAVALSMDCFIVSIAIGIRTQARVMSVVLIPAFCFAIFHAGMTLLGWAAGTGFNGLVADFDHWLVFLLLTLIGVKMIHEGLVDKAETITSLEFAPLLVISLATSLDALAVGASIQFLRMGVLFPALIIGIVVFMVSSAGLMLGMKFKSVTGKRIEIIGGFILILIGLYVVLSHVGAG
jgi:manganese efflux pump family protein